MVGGVSQTLVARYPAPWKILPAARKCPMLVMQEPMKTSSILSPATSDRSLTSSGSLGQARIGSVISARSISEDGGVFGVFVALEERRPASHFSQLSIRRLSVSRVLVALGDHPLHQRDVALQVLRHLRRLEAMTLPAADRSAEASVSS